MLVFGRGCLRNIARDPGDLLAVTDIPDFDELKAQLLALLLTPFGAAGAVLLGIYLLWKKVMSYVEAAIGAVRAGRELQNQLARGLKRHDGGVWYAVATTLIALSVQFAWLTSTILFGNLISLVFGERSENDGRNIRSFGQLFGVLQWDGVVQVYVLICVVSLLVSYRFAKTDSAPVLLFLLCGLPGLFWGVLGAVGATIATVVHLAGVQVKGLDTAQQLGSIWLLVAVGLLFLVVTYMALTSPAAIRRSWRTVT